MKCIFLDDERMPQDVTWIDYPIDVKVAVALEDWIIVRSYLDAVKWIEENGIPDFISFDNDLGDTQNGREGFHVVKHIIGYCIDNNKSFPRCAIHSKNPIAADRIRSFIESFNQLDERLKQRE